jgi:hypothetical protein
VPPRTAAVTQQGGVQQTHTSSTCIMHNTGNNLREREILEGNEKTPLWSGTFAETIIPHSSLLS